MPAPSTEIADQKTLRIATRESLLALWQAEWVQAKILEKYPEINIELVKLKTTGDKILDRPLSQVGGKGLFIKELETALLDGRADLAVHSMKDVTSFFPDGLELSVILEREDPGDAMVSPHFKSLAEMPEGSIIGTSSLRRSSQLKNKRPDLVIQSLRGNLQTRMRKINDREVDAAILAVAGLKRLKLEQHINEVLSMDWMLPAIGQGAIGIEAREADDETLKYIKHLNDRDTWDCVTAERTVLAELEGNCQVPLAGYCILEGNDLFLRALIGAPDGKTVLRAEGRAARSDAVSLGKEVAAELLSQGGKEILSLSAT